MLCCGCGDRVEERAQARGRFAAVAHKTLCAGGDCRMTECGWFGWRRCCGGAEW